MLFSWMPEEYVKHHHARYCEVLEQAVEEPTRRLPKRWWSQKTADDPAQTE
jgi:hypothetical protein